MLLIDGVTFEEYIPKTEDEFEGMVSEHAQEIFGEHSLYFDRKLKLCSLSGIGSIPDGYAITINDRYEWHIVEIELSSHPLYQHIVPQISKFISGINNTNNRKLIIDSMYQALISDNLNYFKMDKVIQTGEYYKFVSDIVNSTPIITIIIEKDTPELHDALDSLNHPKKNVVEFRTLTRKGVGIQVHSHIFEPLLQYKSVFDPLWEYSKDKIREVGWAAQGYTLRYTDGKYEIYEKSGDFSVIQLPWRSSWSTGYSSLEEALKSISEDKKAVGRLNSTTKKENVSKGGKVTIAELVKAGLLNESDILHFYNTRDFPDETAKLVVESDRLLYEKDGETYSKSELAGLLLTKHGFKRGNYPVQGPKFWKTKDGRLLDDLNEKIRIQRGER
jgi:hypothetical protein